MTSHSCVGMQDVDAKCVMSECEVLNNHLGGFLSHQSAIDTSYLLEHL